MVMLITVMVALYLVPLLIHSPCICEKEELPTRPLFIGHRGASAVSINLKDRINSWNSCDDVTSKSLLFLWDYHPDAVLLGKIMAINDSLTKYGTHPQSPYKSVYIILIYFALKLSYVVYFEQIRPENTFYSMETTTSLGAWGLEFDVVIRYMFHSVLDNHFIIILCYYK